MQLEFAKMNGLGNDFIMIEDLDGTLDMSAEAVAWFCDRHFGIGADGLILVRRAVSPDADFAMHYFNADGSLAEMCGNGARCFTKYVVDHGLVPQDASSLVIETLGGPRPVNFSRAEDGTMELATVDMGVPKLAPADIPTLLEGVQVYECPIETPAGVLKVTAVNMGNPHVVIWVDDVETAPVESVGPFFEQHELFPKGTNVEFAQFVADDTIGCGSGSGGWARRSPAARVRAR